MIYNFLVYDSRWQSYEILHLALVSIADGHSERYSSLCPHLKIMRFLAEIAPTKLYLLSKNLRLIAIDEGVTNFFVKISYTLCVK